MKLVRFPDNLTFLLSLGRAVYDTSSVRYVFFVAVFLPTLVMSELSGFHRKPTSKTGEDLVHQRNRDVSISTPEPSIETVPYAGFLGSTSYAAAFSVDQNVNTSNGLDNVDATQLQSRAAVRADHVEAVSKVLHCLCNFSLIERLIKRYYKGTQFAVIAGPIILNALVSINGTVRQRCRGDIICDKALARMLLQNTARPLEVPASLPASDYHSLFTGPNLRLEIIGLIISLAGLASFFLSARDPIFMKDDGDVTDRREFTDQMTDASNTCSKLCEEVGSVNDLLLWLIHQDAVLLSMQRGDSSKFTVPRISFGVPDERPWQLPHYQPLPSLSRVPKAHHHFDPCLRAI